MANYAAVDVGSNSVRMMAAEVAQDGKTKILAQDRQVTRLGAGVFQDGRICEDAAREVCGQLERMAQVFRKLQLAGLRGVATSAVRDASNQQEFLERASASLAAPIEVISGQEEARLIHLGVQTRWPQGDKRALIADVGGGSMEVILSENGALKEAFSKPLGAVRLTESFLKHDPPTALELHQLNQYIDEKLAPAVQRIGQRPFGIVIATSATAAALVCGANGVPRADRDSADRMRATAADVRKLYRDLSRLDLAERRKVGGIGPRRAELIVAGAAVLLRVLELFGASALYYSVAGVRDGIIADLASQGAGRELSQLSRDQRDLVEDMARRYGVQIEHARKVAALARELFGALQPLHKLPPSAGKALEAAACLHDIGHFISDTGHHKHSWYLVANSDMPGFTDSERQLIAALCRYHRKAAPSPRHSFFHTLIPEMRRAVLLLTPLLRLADSFDRGHEQRVDCLHVERRDGNVLIGLESQTDADVELWAAGRIADLFREVYGMPAVLARTKT